jgi:hypothetical protein
VGNLATGQSLPPCRPARGAEPMARGARARSRLGPRSHPAAPVLERRAPSCPRSPCGPHPPSASNVAGAARVDAMVAARRAEQPIVLAAGLPGAMSARAIQDRDHGHGRLSLTLHWRDCGRPAPPSPSVPARRAAPTAGAPSGRPGAARPSALASTPAALMTACAQLPASVQRAQSGRVARCTPSGQGGHEQAGPGPP